jgi:hypothetical protein
MRFRAVAIRSRVPNTILSGRVTALYRRFRELPSGLRSAPGVVVPPIKYLALADRGLTSAILEFEV